MANSAHRIELPFGDRIQAGQVLSGALNEYAGSKDAIVLGLPRGGVIVAAEVAKRLELPLDVFIVRKLGIPGHEELAMGAIASGGGTVINRSLARRRGISENAINAVIEKEFAELRRRDQLYRSGRSMLDVSGKTVLLVDDGIATGATIIAAIRALRKLEPARIVVATPVVTPDVATALRSEADGVISVIEPESLDGVGRWYEDFYQTTDGEILEALRSAGKVTAKPSRSEVA